MKQSTKEILKGIAEIILALIVYAGILYAGKRLEPPWPSIVSLAGLVLLFGVPAILQKRKKRTELEPEAEENFNESEEADAVPQFLLMHHILSGALYQMVRQKDGYAFIKVGNEFAGLREEALAETPVLTETLAGLQMKHFRLQDSEISTCEIRLRHSIGSQFPNCGTVCLYISSGKKKKYVVLGALPKEALVAFFRPVQERIVWLEPGRRWEKAREKDRAFATWRVEGQKAELYRKLKIVGTALNVVSAIIALCFLLIAQPYLLWSALTVLCFFLAIALQIIFPAYFSLVWTEKESLAKTGTRCITLTETLLFSGSGALIRAMLDFNYVSFVQLGIALLIFVCALMALLLAFCKELRIRVGNAVTVFFLLLLLSGGIPAQLNYLLDFAEPRLETVIVVSKEVYKRSKGPDEYRCMILTGEREKVTLAVDIETYSALSPGCTASFATYRGGLGIGYRELYEME